MNIERLIVAGMSPTSCSLTIDNKIKLNHCGRYGPITASSNIKINK